MTEIVVLRVCFRTQFVYYSGVCPNDSSGSFFFVYLSERQLPYMDKDEHEKREVE